MASNYVAYNFRSQQSLFRKSFLCILAIILFLWISFIAYSLLIIVQLLFAGDVRSQDFWDAILLLIGLTISSIAFILLVLKKEHFYTHIIINEDGLVYFNKYRLRPSRIIYWNQISASPYKNHKNERDVYIQHLFLGGEKVSFWYYHHSKTSLYQENFGGYGPFPFLYRNRSALRKAFVVGLLTYREDLRIDPKLLRFAQ